MEFKKFKIGMQKQFAEMIQNNNSLFNTNVEKDVLWNAYLDSFPEGTNNIYKTRREYDCSCCRQFIKNYGDMVVIDQNNSTQTIWDIPDLEYPFNIVAQKMSNMIKSYSIENVFFSMFSKLGTDISHSQDGDKVISFEHFYLNLPKQYVKDNKNQSIESIQAPYRDNKNIFKRSMEELTIEAGNIILELIEQNSIYRGSEFKQSIKEFIKYKKQYKELKDEEKNNWCWVNSFNNSVVRIRNTAIGTLLIDLSEGVEIDSAVSKFEKVMAPTNYKRPKPLITAKMIDEAEKKIKELGFENSLYRRFAVLEDVTVNNVLFANRDAKTKMKGSIFEELKEESKSISAKKFDKVEEVTIEDFIKNILPTTTNLELLIEGRHKGNFVSLIAPKEKDVSTMFKWNNNFSWAYNGDIADSIKQNVAKAGGNVNGILRFSIQWNHWDKYNPNDFDAHCIEPKGNQIYFSQMRNPKTSGILDVDIRHPSKGKPAVENIVWTDKSKMEEGQYVFRVHNFSHNGGTDGFSAEIEYDGQIYSFEYLKELRPKEFVEVAIIQFNKKDGIKFIESLDSSITSQKIWNLNTQQFTKVNVCMLSPNYWDEQKETGNKHYFFFMDKCKNDSQPRSFFNEFLNEKLVPHRKVFEVLGSKLRVEESDNQLSGVGFSSTQKNSIIAKVDGAFTRTIKIIF